MGAYINARDQTKKNNSVPVQCESNDHIHQVTDKDKTNLCDPHDPISQIDQPVVHQPVAGRAGRPLEVGYRQVWSVCSAGFWSPLPLSLKDAQTYAEKVPSKV